MKRRRFVSRSSQLVAGALVIPSLSSAAIHKPTKKWEDTIIGHGDYRYLVDAQWGNLDPGVHPVKNCHEMIMDSSGRLIMVGDETKNNVLIYDKSGKLLDAWGIRYKGGHGLSLWDAGGDEYLFICDNARNNTLEGAGSVIKTTLDGRELMIIGHPSKYGAYKKDEPFSPTETAVAPNGDIYIADGYGSCFVLQFTHKGEFIRKIGGGRGPGKQQFLTAHGVCIDDRDPNNLSLLITSRAHNSFKRFTLDGKYIETLHYPGAFVCRPVIDGENLYAGVCWSSTVPFNPNDSGNTHPNNTNPRSGFVMILDKDNRVVSNPGGTEPSYVDGQLQVMVQEQAVFHHCHDVCIDEDKNIYVCQWNANKSYPIKLTRV